MQGFHRLCATAVVSVARMLFVLPRITFVLDSRVHQKSGNGLKADLGLHVHASIVITSYLQWRI